MSGAACTCRITGGCRASVECDCEGSAGLEERIAVLADVHAFLAARGRAPRDLAAFLADLDKRAGVNLSNPEEVTLSMSNKTGVTPEGVAYTTDEKGVRRDAQGYPLDFGKLDDSPSLRRQREEEARDKRVRELADLAVDTEAKKRLDEKRKDERFERAVTERMKELAWPA